MTWAEAKSKLINLGFEKTTAYTNNAALMVDFINTALVIACSTVRPLKKLHNVTQLVDTEYDMTSVVTDFMRFILPVKVEDEDTPAEYRLTSNTSIKVFGIGDFDIWYSAVPAKITTTSTDGTLLPVQDDIAELAIYYAAWHIWLDDDERKAVMYQNVYDDLKNQIMLSDAQNNPITARINTDIEFNTLTDDEF